jgi:hypothetical protein
MSFNRLHVARRNAKPPTSSINQSHISGNPRIIDVAVKKLKSADPHASIMLSNFKGDSYSIFKGDDLKNINGNALTTFKGDINFKIDSVGTSQDLASEKHPVPPIKRPSEPRCASVSPIRSELIAPVVEDEWSTIFNADREEKASLNHPVHKRTNSNCMMGEKKINNGIITAPTSQELAQKSACFQRPSTNQQPNYFSFRPGFRFEPIPGPIIAQGDSEKNDWDALTTIKKPDIFEKTEVLNKDPYMKDLEVAPCPGPRAHDIGPRDINWTKESSIIHTRGISVDNSPRERKVSQFDSCSRAQSIIRLPPSRDDNKYNLVGNTNVKPLVKDTSLREKANEVLRNLHELSQGDIHIKRENVSNLSASKRKLIFAKEVFSKDVINLIQSKKL